VSGVHAHGRDGVEFEVPARFTVGADGLRSSVAQEVDAPVERRSRTASAVLYGYVAGLDADGYEWAYGGRASAGLIPTEDGLVCVFAATDAARFRGLDGPAPQRFEQLLTEASPALARRVADGQRVGRLRGFGGSPAYLRRPAGSGWALVGDAGYFKDPLSTHGISDALRDADLLARAIPASLGGARDALDHYRRERERLSTALFDVTEHIAGHRWTEEQLRGLLRRLSAAMTDELDTLIALDSGADAVA
jgi:flavin-dependent dehydrogenase